MNRKTPDEGITGLHATVRESANVRAVDGLALHRLWRWWWRVGVSGRRGQAEHQAGHCDRNQFLFHGFVSFDVQGWSPLAAVRPGGGAYT